MPRACGPWAALRSAHRFEVRGAVSPALKPTAWGCGESVCAADFPVRRQVSWRVAELLLERSRWYRSSPRARRGANACGVARARQLAVPRTRQLDVARDR